jgi:hypothetical protein
MRWCSLKEKRSKEKINLVRSLVAGQAKKYERPILDGPVTHPTPLDPRRVALTFHAHDDRFVPEPELRSPAFQRHKAAVEAAQAVLARSIEAFINKIS